MKIAISGTTGLIGKNLVVYLRKQGHEVFPLLRKKNEAEPNSVLWDPTLGLIEKEKLENKDAVIHLGGETIMGRWTASKKDKILKSRALSTQLLANTLDRLDFPPSVFVCASATGFYGNRGTETLDESSEKGTGFLSDVCQLWEQASQLTNKNIRLVNLRIGMVLSNLGGGLKEMLLPFRLGLGGKFGSGQQVVSWISLTELIEMVNYILATPSVVGPVNIVSQQPVTNETFTHILGEVLQRPTFCTMPVFMIKLIFGELGEELFLSSAKVIPKALENAKYKFDSKTLKQVLEINCQK